jgi:hypothetical protein
MWAAAAGIWAVVGASAVLAWSHPGPGARVTAAVHGATAPLRHEPAVSPAPHVARPVAPPPVVWVQPAQTPPVTSTHAS